MKKFFFAAAMTAMMFVSCTKDNNVVGGNNENNNGSNVENNGGNADDNNGGNTEQTVLAVVFNELCGNKVVEYTDGKKYKFIELYNNSDAAVSLAGWTIRKYVPDAKDVEGVYDVCWTAPEGTQIAAGGYLVLISDQEDPTVGFNAGLSASKELKFELVDADNKSVDIFLRGKENAAGTVEETELTKNEEASFSRVPNGNGAWAYAVPTPGAANGEKTGDIEHE